MENEFEKIELCEKDGVGKLKLNGKEIKGLVEYRIKRDTDTINITFTLSVPTSNFKTIED